MNRQGSMGKGMRTVWLQPGSATANISPGPTPSTPSDSTRILPAIVGCTEATGTVALVGESGSGKSSCVALLERWYDPTDGCVLLDGAPIASYSHAALHRHMALVGQEPVLYARSIRDNISYGCEPYGWTPR